MDDETDTWTQRDLIFARTRERLKTKTTAEWLNLFRRNDIWAGPVYGYADLVADPQIAHNGTFVEYDHPTEGRVKTRDSLTSSPKLQPRLNAARRWRGSIAARCCARQVMMTGGSTR